MDDARVIIYDRHMFIVQATVVHKELEIIKEDRILIKNSWELIRNYSG
jgi:hypothetical protein